ILVIAEAFLLNYIINDNEVLTRPSFLPALLYIIFMSSNKAMFILHPLIFGNFFLMLAIHRILNSYRKDKAFSHFFDAGFLIALASLFYFPYIVFFPLLGVALVILRAFNWREWLISFFGVLVPFILVGTIYFVNDTLDYLIYDKMLFYFSRQLQLGALSGSFYFTNSVQLTILILAGARLFTGLNTGSQKTKKGIVLLIWFLLAGIASIAITQEVSVSCFTALAIPASVFYAHYFINLKRKWLAEILFLLFLGSIVVNLISSL
ncbi:MAG TPA: DUF6427 family protein, partial [Bacteroidia bacterium]|nr:DUF6427 family protein [Bacteroidia bacterium]